MKEPDLISVIIPVYNVEKYVRQTLDSVLIQTYKNLEILVVDDGSTDNSGKICDEYLKDKRVKVFHKTNNGNAAARQYGVEQAKGKYFVTIDADDYVTTDFVEKLYKSIKENDADISVCGVKLFNDGKDNFYTGFMPSSSYKRLIINDDILCRDLYKVSLELLLSDVWNKMFKTEFVRKTGVKFELNKIYNGSDLKFNYNIFIYCPVYSVCNEAMLFHRLRNNSRVTKKDKPLQEGFELIIESLLMTSKERQLDFKQQISNVYYWLIGNAIMDIMMRGGNTSERHRRFKKLVRENKFFLKKHKNDLQKHKGLKRFKLGDSKIHLPSMFLSCAFWLDNACFVINFLRKMKSKF